MFGLVSTMWITHVNGHSTPDLDSFVARVSGLPDLQYVRVRVVSFDHVPMILSVKLAKHYFPTVQVSFLYNF